MERHRHFENRRKEQWQDLILTIYSMQKAKGQQYRQSDRQNRNRSLR